MFKFNAVLPCGRESMARKRGQGRPHRTQRLCVPFLYSSLNSLWEWSCPSLGRDQYFAGFPGGGVWTKATPKGGNLKWMPETGMMLSINQFYVFLFISFMSICLCVFVCATTCMWRSVTIYVSWFFPPTMILNVIWYGESTLNCQSLLPA